MSMLRQTLKSVLTSVLPMSRLMTHGPRGTSRGRQCDVALTFDDGPHPELTPVVLRTLGESNMKGTFFVIGERAERHPELIRQIAAEGHELGNHTWSHLDARRNAPAEFLAEVRRTRQLLQDLTGCDCRLTRPPLGNLTVPVALGLWREQQTIVLWNADPKDFAIRNATELQSWLEQYRPATGDIVLLHDVHPHAPAVIRYLREHDRATRGVTLSAWLDRSRRTNASQSNASPKNGGHHA